MFCLLKATIVILIGLCKSTGLPHAPEKICDHLKLNQLTMASTYATKSFIKSRKSFVCVLGTLFRCCNTLGTSMQNGIHPFPVEFIFLAHFGSLYCNWLWSKLTITALKLILKFTFCLETSFNRG